MGRVWGGQGVGWAVCGVGRVWGGQGVNTFAEKEKSLKIVVGNPQACGSTALMCLWIVARRS